MTSPIGLITDLGRSKRWEMLAASTPDGDEYVHINTDVSFRGKALICKAQWYALKKYGTIQLSISPELPLPDPREFPILKDIITVMNEYRATRRGAFGQFNTHQPRGAQHHIPLWLGPLYREVEFQPAFALYTMDAGLFQVELSLFVFDRLARREEPSVDDIAAAFAVQTPMGRKVH